MLRPQVDIASGLATVQPSGKPWSLSHSTGVSRLIRTFGWPADITLSMISGGSASAPPVSSSSFSSGSVSESVSSVPQRVSSSSGLREIVPSVVVSDCSGFEDVGDDSGRESV